MTDNPFAQITLGRSQAYVDQYDPGLLHGIPRNVSRIAGQEFNGVDLWTAYELSWLGAKGKPEVAIAEFSFPADSANLVESKSLKYYLNSFNQTRFASGAEVRRQIGEDLAAVAKAEVAVRLYTLEQFATKRLAAGLLGTCIDHLDIAIDSELPDSRILKRDKVGGVFEGVLVSHLLKSNCPVTGQPDWASLWLGWRGPAVMRDSLLRYIVAYRQHQDFHENCVERIYVDLLSALEPEYLWVYARYTRRGGLDINPLRSSRPMLPPEVTAQRQ